MAGARGARRAQPQRPPPACCGVSSRQLVAPMWHPSPPAAAARPPAAAAAAGPPQPAAPHNRRPSLRCRSAAAGGVVGAAAADGAPPGRPAPAPWSPAALAALPALAAGRLLRWSRRPEARAAMNVVNLLACMGFIVLYVWGTYAPAARGSPRHVADLALSVLFAAEWAWRVLSSSRPLASAASPSNAIDLLSFAPALIEDGLGLAGLLPLDLRWCRVFRRARASERRRRRPPAAGRRRRCLSPALLRRWHSATAAVLLASNARPFS